MTSKSWVLPPVPIPIGPEGASTFGRADVVVDGLDNAGPSYELRIFLNNSEADARTAPANENGYAGSVYVYGHGQPPDAQSRIAMRRYVMATDAVRAAARSAHDISVTLVPVAFDASQPDVDLDGVSVSVLVDEAPSEFGP